MEFDFRHELGKLSYRIQDGAKIYVMFGTGANWEHVLRMYRYLANTDLNCYIDGFVKNDAYFKTGAAQYGRPAVELAEVDPRNSVILISAGPWGAADALLRQLSELGFCHCSSAFDPGWAVSLLMRHEYIRLLQFKGKHSGERCFIIGNGPSLSPADLDMIAGENSFAVNKIYAIFGQTRWRPTYYVTRDKEMFPTIQAELREHIQCPAFYEFNTILGIEDFRLTNFYYYMVENRVQWTPAPYDTVPFSEDPFLLQVGGSVAYACMQLAAYMGFKEIVLLGIDNTPAVTVKSNGMVIDRGHDYKDHFTESYKSGTVYLSRIDFINAAYKSARVYAEQHGISILNATRGGELDVFERAELDGLLRRGSKK
jgi:hypothetical protein